MKTKKLTLNKKTKCFTIKDATYELLRNLGITIICGNPGSTEAPFLMNFPKDFTYILTLHEASAVAIADGISQSIRKPVIVNVHTAIGIENGMGNILTANQNKTPLILTSGNQTREMLLIEPLSTNKEPTILPLPWIKWAYQPYRFEDVPNSFMRAYATSIQEPKGPTYLSIPLDDWAKKTSKSVDIRKISERQGPDPIICQEYADKINNSKNPLIIYGSDISRSNAWDDAIVFAEKINAPVWSAPFTERNSFPETHKLYQGQLKSSIKGLFEEIKNYDLIIVIGCPVFRYYPYVEGSYISKKSHLLLVSDDPDVISRAPVGDGLLCNAKLFFSNILNIIKTNKNKKIIPVRPSPPLKIKKETAPFTATTILQLLKINLPEEYILTEECPSIISYMQDIIRIKNPDSFYTCSSGGLGWAMPASIGLSIGEKIINRNRPVICLIGDGSFQYSIQSLYTGVQHKAHVIYIVFQNNEYGILKEFAVSEKLLNIPGLNIDGLDIVSISKGYGAYSVLILYQENFEKEIQKALKFKQVSVIVIPTKKVSGGLTI